MGVVISFVLLYCSIVCISADRLWRLNFRTLVLTYNRPPDIHDLEHNRREGQTTLDIMPSPISTESGLSPSPGDSLTQGTISQKLSSSRQSGNAPKKRAPIACLNCRVRKVRCDVAQAGAPCTNCRLDGETCVLAQSKRRRYDIIHTSSQGETRAPRGGICKLVAIEG